MELVFQAALVDRFASMLFSIANNSMKLNHKFFSVALHAMSESFVNIQILA
jgi:hypothetical protein